MSYEKSASFVYDAIYEAMKNYRLEAERIQALAAVHCLSSGLDLLDVACGTGLHDQYLREWFNVTALDLDPHMLATARRRNPAASYHQADMTSFDLGRKFDVVTNLFSAIGHTDLLNEAVATAARHLRPGGVHLLEGSFNPLTWQAGYIGRNLADGPDYQISRASVSTRSGDHIELELHYLVATPGKAEYFVEHHRIRLYTTDEYEQAFRLAELSFIHDPDGISANGRGIFIGVKPV